MQQKEETQDIQLPLYDAPDVLVSTDEIDMLIHDTVLVSCEEQHVLLVEGAHDTLLYALRSFIDGMIARYPVRSTDRDELRAYIEESVEYTGGLYCNKQAQEKYSFAAYFSWFVLQMLESYRHEGIAGAQIFHDTLLGHHFGTSDWQV
jgi:hypothetical protein